MFLASLPRTDLKDAENKIVRLVALGMYVALWAGTRWALSGMGGPRLG